MIEILFGYSEAESIRVAKPRGTSKEVVCLDFHLDIGNIREAPESAYRRELLWSLRAADARNRPKDREAALKKEAERQEAELSRLGEFLKAGETLRVWYSDSAYARCGLYELCARLRGYDGRVCAVKLPEYRVHGQVITRHNSWRSVSAEEFRPFLKQENALTKNEIRMFAQNWSELTEDNSPLRAVVNGKLTGVPEDFYDFLIWKRLGAEPVKEGHLIGDLIGRYQLDIEDFWYAARIEQFIREGKIRVAEDAEQTYQRMICR